MRFDGFIRMKLGGETRLPFDPIVRSLPRASRFMNPPSSRGIGWTSSLETIVRLIVWIDRRRSISIIKYFGKLAHFDVGSKRSDFPEARDTWVGFEPR